MTAARKNRDHVLQIRFNPNEYDALERMAEERHLPVSTMTRALLLDELAAVSYPFHFSHGPASCDQCGHSSDCSTHNTEDSQSCDCLIFDGNDQ